MIDVTGRAEYDLFQERYPGLLCRVGRWTSIKRCLLSGLRLTVSGADGGLGRAAGRVAFDQEGIFSHSPSSVPLSLVIYPLSRTYRFFRLRRYSAKYASPTNMIPRPTT